MNKRKRSKPAFDPAQWLEKERENLEATQYALATKKYRQARREMVDPLLREARILIKQAAGVLERNPELKGGDSYVAFDACLTAAYRDMQLALRDPAVAIGTKAWEKAKKGGDIRAEIRWHDKRILSDLYRRFARRQDALGLAKPGDIYDDFVECCENEEIDAPPSNTFRTRLARTRKELRLTK